MKHSIDTIGNRIRDLPAFSAVSQPNAPPRVTNTFIDMQIFKLIRVALKYALLNITKRCFFLKPFSLSGDFMSRVEGPNKDLFRTSASMICPPPQKKKQCSTECR